MKRIKRNAHSLGIPSEIDIPVVINFFARPQTFERVLNRISEVKPSKLFLLADGPRLTVESDKENCKRCRDIAKNIPWDCDVYEIYSDTNIGLFNTYFDGMKLVFEIVDRCIFIEDDLLLSKSFFPFAKELLERFKDDLRINFISSMNVFGKYENPDSDYFFSGESSIWGYAIWKRTFESMTLDFTKNHYVIEASKDVAKQIKKGYEKRIDKTVRNPLWEGHIPHVEFHKNFLRCSQNQISIVPKYNMLQNIGFVADSVHTASSLKKIPHAVQKLFTIPTFEITFPLKHPSYCVRDLNYEKEVNRILGWNKPLVNLFRKMEALIRHLIYGDFSRIFYKFRTLIKKDSWT